MNIKLFVLEEANTSYIMLGEITSSLQGSCLSIKVSNAPQKLCEPLCYGYKSEERVGVCTTLCLEEPVKRTAMKVNSY